MKPLPFVIALASAGFMAAAGTAAHAQASSSAPAKRTPPAASRQAEPPPPAAAPSGDTQVHKFFQAWGRGMDKAGNALEKAPKPDHRWPGKANTQRPPDTSPKGDPYSSP